MFGLSTLETYLASIGLALLALVAWSAHERAVGEKAIRDADAQQLVVAEQKAAQQTAALQAQVDVARQEASDAQITLNRYIADHPVGRVVCSVTPSGPVPQGPGTTGGTQGGGTGPNVVPGVPPSTTTGDIGPGLTILVQAAARLAVLEHEWEHAINGK